MLTVLCKNYDAMPNGVNQHQNYTTNNNHQRNTSISFEGARGKRNSNIMSLGGVLTPNNYITADAN